MIIRPANMQDLPALMDLSAALPAGMTSMPCNEESWLKKLQLVEQSFSVDDESSVNEAIFFFVLENPENGEIAGTCGMHTGVGLTRPFYNYKLSKHLSKSEQLGISVRSNTLNLCNDFTGETELVSLFLKEPYRAGKNGQFLSRSRFVFMHDFSSLFSEVVFAEIRGWIDHEGNSPFWDALGNKFFNMPFLKADFISAVNGYQFISDLMPRFPVYLELLPDEAVSVVGQPNRDSAAAKKLLEREGFQYQGLIDIFDAGPVVQCDKNRIKSFSQTQQFSIAGVDERIEAEATLNIVTNRRLKDFRALVSPVLKNEDNSIVLPPATLDALGVKVGDDVSVLTLR